MESIQIKITESILKKVDPSINRISDTVISGFHVRLGKTDKQRNRTTKFYLYYRIGGRTGTSGNYLIGSHGSIDVKTARSEAKQLFGQVARGIDINHAKRKTRQATIDEKSAPVLNSLLDDFESHAEQQRK
ncbi:Arm DNA-binding domain-containing protein [Salinimonas sediminis]|uniref:DUF4102 domain-containing protein n=1 Tax=Salinimonas sediminis TaxID=2303538 RepID=A0A346NNC3_9ALTE|nr:Arm DNA-binding domain-containing protein [Salinimonas sediminis]AXR07030.1 DUF4102 domain-containing protein [Salinimonas sediminis]